MEEMILAFFNYGYKVKTPEGKKGYVTGVTEDWGIKINLRENPYSGEHHIIEPASNLEILAMDNPFDICDIEYDLVPKGQTPFIIAKLEVLDKYPQVILDNPEYFTVLQDDDWIEFAEKRLEELRYGKWGKIKKYYNKVFNALFNRATKKEINQGVKSLIDRLEEEDKRN